MAEGYVRPPDSGTPQDGLTSLIRRNVVLPAFDRGLEERWQAHPPPLTAQQQHARVTREYARHQRHLGRWRAQLPGRMPMGRQPPEG
jgi:hypothetical protein